jgi:hypothetical protein
MSHPIQTLDHSGHQVSGPFEGKQVFFLKKSSTAYSNFATIAYLIGKYSRVDLWMILQYYMANIESRKYNRHAYT